MVKIPTVTHFCAKMAQKAAEQPDGGQGAQFDSTQWFKHNDTNTILCSLTKICPLPPFLAYDAFLENVTAHVIWERVVFHEDNHPQEAEYFRSEITVAALEFFVEMMTSKRSRFGLIEMSS